MAEKLIGGLKGSLVNAAMDKLNVPQGAREVVGLAMNPKGYLLNKAVDYAKDKLVNRADAPPTPPSPTDNDYRDYNRGEFKKGGKVSSASSRADGCAQRGKTRGRMV
jgi:hypothetical protein